jgi:hypothetical protein
VIVVRRVRVVGVIVRMRRGLMVMMAVQRVVGMPVVALRRMRVGVRMAVLVAMHVRVRMRMQQVAVAMQMLMLVAVPMGMIVRVGMVMRSGLRMAVRLISVVRHATLLGAMPQASAARATHQTSLTAARARVTIRATDVRRAA